MERKPTHGTRFTNCSDSECFSGDYGLAEISTLFIYDLIFSTFTTIYWWSLKSGNCYKKRGEESRKDKREKGKKHYSLVFI